MPRERLLLHLEPILSLPENAIAGFRCYDSPPEPPSVSSLVFHKEHMWGGHNYAQYNCNVGGHNIRLNWRQGDDNPRKFFVKCVERENNVMEWLEPEWPTCAVSKCHSSVNISLTYFTLQILLVHGANLMISIQTWWREKLPDTREKQGTVRLVVGWMFKILYSDLSARTTGT